MEEMRNAYFEEREHPENHAKNDIQELWYDGVDWIQLAQDTVCLRAL
jgi:hypothetical protein